MMHQRYEDPVMRETWSRGAQVDHWLKVELAWLKHCAPDAHQELAETVHVERIRVDPFAMARRENETGHEFVAFLDELELHLPTRESRRWVHFGLTSSDVIDAAQALLMLRANTRIKRRLAPTLDHLDRVADEMMRVSQTGRTHGQHSTPRPAGIPLAALRETGMRILDRLEDADSYLAEADFSGPAGAREFVHEEAVTAALEELGLVRAFASTQIVARDGIALWAHQLAQLVTWCESLAEHYWLLAQTEVNEVAPGGVGSSAMPHKNNPAVAENLMGLGRMARAIAPTVLEGLVQRGDRDLAHSSVERTVLPDLCHLAMTALVRVRQILEWEFDTEQMEANRYEQDDSFVRVTKAVLGGMTRAEARQAYQDGKI